MKLITLIKPVLETLIRNHRTASLALILRFSALTGHNACGQEFEVLYSFAGSDGANPQAALAQGSDGYFYGTTEYGGTSGGPAGGYGTVFRVDTNGALSSLVSFSGEGSIDGVTGANPLGALVQASDGYFYGTTLQGGAFNYGSVFRLDPTSGTVYSWAGFNGFVQVPPTGKFPLAGVVQGSDGYLYGTTSEGGPYGVGTFFRASVQTKGYLTNLCSLGGEYPSAALVQGNDGYFYGTTANGGTGTNGTVFRVSAAGSLTQLVSFAGTNGATPLGSLVQGKDGYFYGTTYFGGAYNYGTVFRMTTNGTVTTLVSFDSYGGANPAAGLVQGSDGYFYGTTFNGGDYDYGTVFQMATNGAWATLYSFDSFGGANPAASLVQGSDGFLYGTTVNGGDNDLGTVFRIAPPINPSIVAQPQSQTNVAGAVASFSVSASGTAPLSYQWQQNGTNLSGGGQVSGTTTNLLAITNLGLANAGSYTVIVTNAYGSVTSSVAVLVVVSPPVITAQPASQNVLYGATTLLSVAASGSLLSYQWYLNGSLLVGATGSNLSLTAGAPTAGAYTVVVTNVEGAVTSSIARLAFFSQAGPIYAFTNFAGLPGTLGHSDGTGVVARFKNPQGICLDNAGNLYVGDYGNSTIRKVTAAAAVSTLAGQALNYGWADGTGSAAVFNWPIGVAADSAGNVYVADTINNLLRRVTPAGDVTTLAGSVGVAGSSDGNGSSARFYAPNGIATDSAGNIYVADFQNHTVRKMTFNGTNWVVSTLAGLAGSFGSADGAGSQARFYHPADVAVDAAGNVYVADYNNHTIRMITPAGVVTTLAGSPGNSGSADGTGSAARFDCPNGVAVDNAGNVYVVDAFNHTIRKIGPGAVVTTIGGLAGTSGTADGVGSTARFYLPAGLVVDSAGNIYVVDYGNHRLTKGTPVATPTITFPPQGGSFGCGSNAAVSVTAIGLEPLAYQWYLGNSPVSGATNRSYSFTLASATAGNYTVVVTNAYGALTSSVASVMEVDAAPVIAAQPQSQTNLPGTIASFSVGASSCSALAYQWLKNGTNLTDVGNVSGSATANLTLTNVSHSDAAVYSVLVSNAGGSVTSSVAALLVAGPPAINQPPVSQSLSCGANAVLSVTASSLVPFSYQWFLAGTLLPGATNSNYAFTLTPATLGNYTVVVSNAVGAVTSAVAAVSEVPVIIAQPQNRTNAAGFRATFSVAVNSCFPVIYQWQRNGTNLADGGNITGSASTLLQLNTTSLTDAGGYTVVVNDGHGAVTSSTAVLSVVSSPTMSVGRFGHTATLLTNGLVLITGGKQDNAAGDQYSSAELYDPGTGLCHPTGSLTTIRVYHTATLLNNGQVLVVGGYGPDGSSLASAELYDPIAGTFTLTGSLHGGHSGHAATLLPSGKVLINGGDNGGPKLATAEVYDPTAGSFTQVGNMSATRGYPATVLLPNGLVLVAGGLATGNIYLSSAEVFDPGSGVFAPTNGMSVARYGGTASLLPSGNVLEAGGSPADGISQASAELFQGVFSLTSPMSTNRDWQTATSLTNGNVLIAGGLTTSGACLPSAEVYVPGAGFTVLSQQLATGRYDHRATLLPSGKVLLSGGIGAAGSGLSSLELLDLSQTISFPAIANQLASNPPFTLNATASSGLPVIYTVVAGANVASVSNNTVTLSGLPGSVTIEASQPGNAVYDPATAVFVSFSVVSPPYITAQPSSLTNAAGTTATFAVTAAGFPPPAYQWQMNGTNLTDGGRVSGTISNLLTIASVGMADAGSYTVVLTNLYGSVTSSVATLALVYPPSITQPPSSQNSLYGASATLSVTATGSGLGYQWYFKGTPLAGATSSNLTVTATTATAGSYTVVVSNLAGSVTNPPVTLGVFSSAGPAYAWTNFVGQPQVAGGLDGTGSAAQFNHPDDAVADSAGNLYVADSHNCTIRKVTPAGLVTTLAGSAGSFSYADGTGSAARFNDPSAVAVDRAGNLYVAEYGNNTIRKVTPVGTNWVVTTLAGSAGQAGSADGTGSAARFSQPEGVAVDSAGNVYVADTANDTIREIRPVGTNWVVTTLAGSAGHAGSTDGVGSAAQFSWPSGVAVDSAGNVYVADAVNSTVRKIAPVGTNWVVTTLAGSAGQNGGADGTGSAAQFLGLTDLTLDGAGNVYVADTYNFTIRRVTPAGVVTTIGGLAGVNGVADGIGSDAGFAYPRGIVVDTAGNLYVADIGNNRITKGTPSVLPYVLAQPQSAAFACGGSAQVAATGVGLEPISYQWYFAGSPVSGATNSSYSFTLTPATVGNYTVVVTNAYGAVTSSVANITASGGAQLTILSGPTNQIVNADTNCQATLPDLRPQVVAVACGGSVTVSQNPAPGTSLGLGTNLVTLTATDAYSDTTNLTVAVVVADVTPPTIVSLPGPQTVFAYGDCLAPAPDLRPQVTATDCSGPVTVSQTPPPYTTLYGGTNYITLSVRDVWNNVTNAVVSVIVVGSPPTFSCPQSSLNLMATSNCTAVLPDLTSEIQEFPGEFCTYQPFTVQQYPAPGTVVTPGASGSIIYAVVVVSGSGTNTNFLYNCQTFYSLPQAPPPVLATQPSSLTNSAGTQASFSVSASGCGTLTYQWRKNGVPLANSGRVSGAGTPTLNLNSVVPGDAGGYSVVVTNLGGASTSAVASLTISIPPQGVSSGVGYAFSQAGSGPMNPYGRLVQAADGTLYGTSDNGGAGGDGTVFQVGTNGSLVSAFSFASTNGANPYAGLLTGSDGAFYGTTYNGGTNGVGTVFRVNTNGVLTSLYSFTGGNGGAYPKGLAQGSDGYFYGTTQIGGSYRGSPPHGNPLGYGTVFRVDTNGHLTTLVSFANTNGANPAGALLAAGRSGFYGTTINGGAAGLGTIFNVTTNGTLTTLFSFAGTNGQNPAAGLVTGADGALYGTTYSGGTGTNGTVFKFTPGGALTTLASFGGTNGANPAAELLAGTDGSLYGTTVNGGAYGDGTVFQLTPQGALNPLLTFNGTNGANPQGALIRAADGSLYGTTVNGGTGGAGTVYRVSFDPWIAKPPAGGTVFVGSAPTLSVTAQGTSPLAYQWQYNGTNLVDGGNISGAFSSTLVVSGITTNQAGLYSVLVAGPGGSVTSLPAAISVVTPGILLLNRTPDFNYQVSFLGYSNYSAAVNMSTDLLHWSVLTNFPPSDGPLQFQDLNATNSPQRFYRAVWMP